MNTDFDVIVVGGGPSGALAGYGAANAGLRVLILEKVSFPRVKPCAGGLTIKSLKALPFSVAPVIHRVSTDISFAFEYHDARVMHGTGPVCAFVDRSEFDQFLLNKAIEVGAEILVKTGIVSIDTYDGHVRVTFADGEKLSALFLVGADGANSTVRRLTSNADWFSKGFALEGLIFDQNLADTEGMKINFSVVDKGYGWIFPKKDHINIGLYTTQQKGALAKKQLLEYASKMVGDHTVENIVGFPIGLNGGNYITKHHRIALIGDAGGWAEPLFGEGLHNAILSGVVVGEELPKMLLEGKNFSQTLDRRMARARSDLALSQKLATKIYSVKSRTDNRSYPSFIRRIIKNNFMKGICTGKSTETIVKYFVLAPFWRIKTPTSLTEFFEKNNK
jgi:geranylgeranyl reductase family protein